MWASLMGVSRLWARQSKRQDGRGRLLGAQTSVVASGLILDPTCSSSPRERAPFWFLAAAGRQQCPGRGRRHWDLVQIRITYHL